MKLSEVYDDYVELLHNMTTEELTEAVRKAAEHVGGIDDNVCCGTCKWHEDFNWVCFNGDSPYCADFTSPDTVCQEWEEHADGAEKGVEK